jgi:ABC-2 type transport system permease protein
MFLLSGASLAVLGLIAGIVASKFDHLAAFTNFIITPLSFLSGVFYSVHSLPPFWFAASLFNPFFYMIDGFRYGFIGRAEGNLAVGAGLTAGLVLVLGFVCYRMFETGYKIKT